MAKSRARKSQSEDTAKLQAVIAGLEKTYGGGVLQTVEGNPSLQRFNRQIPSGSINLDIALGVMFRRPNGTWQTGYAPGRIVEIFGGEGCGKTTLTLLMIANAQALGVRCAFLDMEHALDVGYAQALGVNLSELHLSQPASGEQCIKIAESLLKSGMFGLIVIDSLVALLPKTNEAKNRDHVGVQVQSINQSLGFVNAYLPKDVSCNLVVTSPIHKNFGVRASSPRATPVGDAFEFGADVRIEVTRTGHLRQGETVYGHKVVAVVTMSGAAGPAQDAQFDLVYGRGVDYLGELLDLGLAHGVIRASEACYSWGDIRLGQDRPQTTEFLRRNRHDCYHIYNSVMTQIMAHRGFQADGTPSPRLPAQGA